MPLPPLPLAGPPALKREDLWLDPPVPPPSTVKGPFLPLLDVRHCGFSILPGPFAAAAALTACWCAWCAAVSLATAADTGAAGRGRSGLSLTPVELDAVEPPTDDVDRGDDLDEVVESGEGPPGDGVACDMVGG